MNPHDPRQPPGPPGGPYGAPGYGPQGYGPQGQQPGYGPQGQQPGYGPQGQGQPPGYGPQGFAPPGGPGFGPPQGYAQAPAKSGMGVGAIIAIVLAVILVLFGGAGAAAYFLTQDLSSSSKPAAAAPGAPAAPGGATAPGVGEMPDWATLFGTPAEGWNPRIFGRLKEDMTPAQAEAVFPGASKVDQFGFADIPGGATRGVLKYRLTYQQNKLKFGEIWFKKVNDSPQFKTALVQASTAKWGPTTSKPEEEMQMWISPDFHMVSVSKIIDMEIEGWQIQVALK